MPVCTMINASFPQPVQLLHGLACCVHCTIHVYLFTLQGRRDPPGVVTVITSSSVQVRAATPQASLYLSLEPRVLYIYIHPIGIAWLALNYYTHLYSMDLHNAISAFLNFLCYRHECSNRIEGQHFF